MNYGMYVPDPLMASRLKPIRRYPPWMLGMRFFFRTGCFADVASYDLNAKPEGIGVISTYGYGVF